MIKKLDNTIKDEAEKMQAVFYASYSIEAELLGVANFPPLDRSVANFIKSKTAFYGYYYEGELAAVIELDIMVASVDICSLVVSPMYFRKGIAKKLLTFTQSTFPKLDLTVETGVRNEPAIQLYQNFGFIEQERWMISIGIEKVKFELHNNL